MIPEGHNYTTRFNFKQKRNFHIFFSHQIAAPQAAVPFFIYIYISYYCVPLQLSLADEQCEVTRNGYESKELVYLVQIYCQVRGTSL